MTTLIDAFESRERWIEAHPYLEGIADFQELVERAAGAAPPLELRPDWAAYAADLEAGVPLLQSPRAALDVAPAAGEALAAVVSGVAAADLPPTLAEPARRLDASLRRDPRAARAAIAWLLCGAPEQGEPGTGGLARHLGWTTLQRVLAPLIAEFGRWRDEERWRRGACPTCGAAPGVGALVAEGEGRRRELACGCCRTRWAFERVACPFCGSEDAEALGVLEVAQEPGLRLDVCEGCKGYVKTYAGAGAPDLFLADWPTLHLDLLARERGYRRLGATLYELPEA